MLDLQTTDILQRNIQNYGPYAELVLNGFMNVYTKDITIENLSSNFVCLLNIFRDGIEQERVHSMKVNVIFEDNESVILSVFEYFVNLIFWKAPLSANDRLTSRFFFYVEEFTADDIKSYIDDNYLDLHGTEYNNKELNVVIDDVLEMFKVNDEFAVYYMNTINNEDTIYLMNRNPEFYQCVHADLRGIPLESVNDVANKITDEAISHIMNSDHCLANAFKAKESVNRKQFREFIVAGGTVVNGEGGIYPTIINSSFANEGVKDIKDFFLDATKGRESQIINKENVGTSGSFARQLSLNNRETFLNANENYSCRTKNLVEVHIKNATILKMYKNRYFRYTPNGVEYKMSSNPVRDNKLLIGKTLYFRSPMTCESNVFGNGICRKCYGDLYFTNIDINIGQIASELLSSRLTQMLLSAKHLLEARVEKLVFPEIFYYYFELVHNIIKVKEGIPNPENTFIVIDNNAIQSEDENDNFEYNNYCTGFFIRTPDGTTHPIMLQSEDYFYLTDNILHRIDDGHLEDDGTYVISMNELQEANLFLINMNNNELSKTLKGIKSLIDKEESIKDITLSQFIEKLIDAVIDGGIKIDAVHLEVLISNQIRKFVEDRVDILDLPDWSKPNEKYSLITLSKALITNPSVTVALEYQYTKRILIDPLTYAKHKPSSTDLIFQVQPQIYANMEPEEKKYIKSDREVIFEPIKFLDEDE